LDATVAIAVCYCGSLDRSEKILQPLATLGAPLAKDVAIKSYTQTQTLFDSAWPMGRLYYIKSSVVRRLDAAAIDSYLDWAGSCRRH
jgi:hypothetical protein